MAMGNDRILIDRGYFEYPEEANMFRDMDRHKYILGNRGLSGRISSTSCFIYNICRAGNLGIYGLGKKEKLNGNKS